jgi:large subunit ribosomal protein L18
MVNKREDSARLRRQARVRKKIKGSDGRPRVCVFRSNKHIYAQVISDDQGKTLAAAKLVGLMLAKLCKEKNITEVVFDRNGFLYHGRVKAVADGAREGGLKF